MKIVYKPITFLIFIFMVAALISSCKKENAHSGPPAFRLTLKDKLGKMIIDTVNCEIYYYLNNTKNKIDCAIEKARINNTNDSIKYITFEGIDGTGGLSNPFYLYGTTEFYLKNYGDIDTLNIDIAKIDNGNAEAFSKLTFNGKDILQSMDNSYLPTLYVAVK